MSEVLYRRAQEQGITDVEIELANDDGWYSVALDHAFDPDCLLPVLLAPMERTYRQMWMDRVGFEFPLGTEGDDEAAFGLRAVWRESGAPASLALLCALDVLADMTSPDEPVLRLQMAA